MSPSSQIKVEPSDLENAATAIEGISTSLGHSLRELAGVQHAQQAADSPEVAAAMMALVDAWGTELADVTMFVSEMADKLRAAGTCYVSTDAKAADWAQFMPQLSPRLTGR
jgi:uncharacterized protein YukE